MELADAGKSLRQPTRGQSRPRFIHHVDIVMILRPIVANKDHVAAS